MAHSLIILATTFIAISLSSIATGEKTLSASTISASPSISPDYISPSLSPTLSPDISPLSPSPSGSNLSPSESSVPLIPSSPSPPNPDAMEEAPGPGAALSPSDGLPESSSDGVNVAVLLSSMVVVLAGIWVNQDMV